MQQLIIIGQRQQLIKCAWIWFLYVLHFLSNKSPRNINNYRISSSRKAQLCGQIKVNNILNLRVIRYDCLPPLFCPLWGGGKIVSATLEARNGRFYPFFLQISQITYLQMENFVFAILYSVYFALKYMYFEDLSRISENGGYL